MEQKKSESADDTKQNKRRQESFSLLLLCIGVKTFLN
ncbi:hypothetical protein Tsp_07684 [Trichinella spiralis]|nr:hypothetical protein Tsp_07684 [Trichinella spiralis]